MVKKIAVVNGGYSGEAVISLQSAEEVLKNLDKDRYEGYKVVIYRDRWVLESSGNEIPIDKNDFSAVVGGTKIRFDVAFIVLHGPPGEDGKLQGYLEMLGIPYTSCDVLVSALTFNKFMTNSVLANHGINVARSIVVQPSDHPDLDAILKKVTLPCFVKPNEGGSSLGTTKVNERDQLAPALKAAFKEQSAAIVEEFIKGTEITCGVAKIKGAVQALAITEIVAKKEFFDFEAKYKDKATEEITPARISKELEMECKALSERIYSLLNCRGVIRIDFIIQDNNLFLLEVNSIPGLTQRSLVPQMAEYAGISRTELFTNTIEEALSN